jgi:hypothetical protein
VRILRLESETYADVVRRILALRDSGYDVNIDWLEIEGLLKEHDELKKKTSPDEGIKVGDVIKATENITVNSHRGTRRRIGQDVLLFGVSVGSRGLVTGKSGKLFLVKFDEARTEVACDPKVLRKTKTT